MSQLNWKKIAHHGEIPKGRDKSGRLQYFLAIHHSVGYTSDVIMIWVSENGTVNRWDGRNAFPITHIAEFNLPSSWGESDWLVDKIVEYSHGNDLKIIPTSKYEKKDAPSGAG